MVFNKPLLVITALFVAAANVDAQNIEYANAPVNEVYSQPVATSPEMQIQASGCSSCAQAANVAPAPTASTCPGAGCCLTGPTVAPVMPQLPVRSCCIDTGPLHVPRVTTPLRYDTPPVGRAVGRPIFGRWYGF